jgi:TM2 domain-containing membrane protein YozV
LAWVKKHQEILIGYLIAATILAMLLWVAKVWFKTLLIWLISLLFEFIFWFVISLVGRAHRNGSLIDILFLPKPSSSPETLRVPFAQLNLPRTSATFSSL